jgi:hypothetical protein
MILHENGVGEVCYLRLAVVCLKFRPSFFESLQITACMLEGYPYRHQHFLAF